MKSILIQTIAFLAALTCTAREKGFFHNPVIRSEMADPSVIRIGDTYYATGTSSEWAPFYPLYKSSDLVNWEQSGHIFETKPEWTSNSFWAPELFFHDGKVYCYYTARRKDTGVSYIGVATADSPDGPFTDRGPVVEYGSEAIDAFVFEDEGRLYISWKAYGLDKRPIKLLCAELDPSGIKLAGEPFSLLKDEQYKGMEGQYQFKKDGYYYIIYSSHGCCGPQSDYDVCVARSRNFRGPYEKYEGNPILCGGDGEFMSCGHGTVTVTPDGRMFYLCHAYLKGDGFYAGRQPVLHEMEMTEDGWVKFKSGKEAVTRCRTPFKGTVQKVRESFSDGFNGKSLGKEWCWNYAFAEVSAGTHGGKLSLSGRSGNGRYTGAALCVRPAFVRYTCETAVLYTDAGFKGLTLYGDRDNMLVWGTENGTVSLKRFTEGVEETLFSAPHSGTTRLKITVEADKAVSFMWKGGGGHWKEAAKTAVDISRLTRWDRTFRPGLIHCGKPEDHAIFKYFKISYKPYDHEK